MRNVFAVGLLAVFVVFVYTGLRPAAVVQPTVPQHVEPLKMELAENESHERLCKDSQHAYAASTELLKRVLLSPGSARFPAVGNEQVLARAYRPCVFNISSYVDAENEFRAKVRTYYQMDVEYQPESQQWVVKEIRM